MKKLISILLAFTLILALAACGETAPAPVAETEAPAPAETAAPETAAPETPAPEPEISAPAEEEGPQPEEQVTGVWYGQIEGVDLRLELQADGAYSLNLPAAPEESLTGVWRLEDGFVWLDDSSEPLAVMGDSLYWYSVGAFISREEPAPIYTPAPLVEGAPPGTMDGYWVAAFLEVDGQVFSAEMLGEDLDLYVEGQCAALGGLFGDQIVDLEAEDGVLRFAGDGFCADLALQADGVLRLTLSGDFEGELCYYLLPVMLNNAVVEDD